MSLENDVVGWMLGCVDFVLFVELDNWIRLDLEIVIRERCSGLDAWKCGFCFFVELANWIQLDLESVI